jgi:hypothetical protein
MKKVLKTKQLSKSVILLLGILTGIFVLGTSSFYYQIKSTICAHADAAVDKASKSETTKTVVAAYDAVSQIVSVQLVLPALHSFEVSGDNNNEDESEPIFSISNFSSTIITLLTTVISPNAP